ncbi:hypothetical protein ABZS86_07540, partial [Streptomyces sp. NPDC005355]
MNIGKKVAFLAAAAGTMVIMGAGGAAAHGIGGFQKNDCDAATGPNVIVGGLAPTGDVNVGSKCTNLAFSNESSKGYGKESSKGYGKESSKGYGKESSKGYGKESSKGYGK